MLLWIDTETTGLDPDKDALLEVALVVTTNDLTEVHAASWVLPFDQGAHPHPIHEIVQKMHAGNGLWEECARRAGKDHQDPVGGVAMREHAAREILAELRRWTERGRAPLCGSTVSFDRNFLRRHMPEVEAHFSHRHVDVSTLGELAERLYPEAWAGRPKAEAHRALPDIRHSIKLMEYWRETVLR